MKQMKMILLVILSSAFILSGCASWNKTTKGAVVGTAAGGAMGAVIGKVAGNTAIGAIIGAAVGGGAGAIIGHQMDKQAEEIKKTVPDAKVERVGEGIVVEFSSNVLFGFDKSNLSADATVNLDKLVKVLNSYPDTDIEIQGSRVRVQGFGESVPKYDNSTSDGRAQNRRVEFLIAANDKMKADAAKTVSK
jgi:outer membrane protein OmpA-like peptidoglycan-associated protein